MKKFLLKLFFWFVPIIGLHLFLGSFAGGNTDSFYKRFTSPQQSNLILGNSRAAQGVRPEFLQATNGEKFYNYSFTIFDSPYGEAYFKSIEKKLNPDTKNGNFIVTVDPWSISINKENPNEMLEKDLMIGKTKFNNMNPNYEYLIKNYHNSWFSLYQTRDELYKSKMYLNDDGWLEINITFDTKEEYEKNVQEKVNAYQKYTQDYILSQERVSWLEKTILLLQKHGKVILVKLPQGEKIHAIEKGYMPEFSQLMHTLSQKHQIKFLDYSEAGNQYQYVDGNHLQKDSGKEFTKKMNDSLKKYFK